MLITLGGFLSQPQPETPHPPALNRYQDSSFALLVFHLTAISMHLGVYEYTVWIPARVRSLSPSCANLGLDNKHFSPLFGSLRQAGSVSVTQVS